MTIKELLPYLSPRAEILIKTQYGFYKYHGYVERLPDEYKENQISNIFAGAHILVITISLKGE